MINHPEFSSLKIMEGPRGDAPRPGAFYAPKKGDNLSKIAASSYGDGRFQSIQKINKNPHNLKTRTYRRNSARCSSRKVGPADVLEMSSWSSASQGWLSLCPGDRGDLERRIGFAYPLIWIPQNMGDIPKKDVTPKAQPKLENLKRGLIRIKTVDPESLIDEPVVTPGHHDPVVTPDEPEPEIVPGPTPQPAKAGMSGWLVGLLSAGVVGGIAWAILREK